MVIVTNCPFHVIKITLVGQEDRKIVSIKRLISIPPSKGRNDCWSEINNIIIDTQKIFTEGIS